MAKKFSVLSWNVEHFKVSKKKTDKIIQHIKSINPDVLAIYEVEGAEVFSFMTEEFSKYSFFITEGPQTQEILVGTKNTLQSFTSQRIAFKRGISALRPGTLTTITHKGENYSLLFLHTKSFQNPGGFGIRDDQFQHAFNLKKKLDKNAGGTGKAKMIVAGDLNTMGLDYYSKDIDASYEIEKLGHRAGLREMRIIDKDHHATWTGLKPGNKKKLRFGDLDHVIASDQIEFNMVGDDGKSHVKVSGWKELLSDDETKVNSNVKKFMNEVSDHCSLYFEIS